MNVVYPNLEHERETRGITKTSISKMIGVSPRSLYNKMNGIAPFTYEEACTVHQVFFPDKNIDELFQRHDT